MRVKCLAQEHNKCPQPEVEPGLRNTGPSTLNIKTEETPLEDMSGMFDHHCDMYLKETCMFLTSQVGLKAILNRLS